MSPADSAREPIEPLFPQLSPGRSSSAREDVDRYQRMRLQAAMTEACFREGYLATTIGDLTRLAGVSRSTFYEHFENKLDCFLVTFEAIVAEVTTRVAEEFRPPGDLRARLVRALGCFAQVAVEKPAAAWLTTVESLTLGKAGVVYRDRAAAHFEAMVRESFDHSPSGIAVDEITVRAIVAGIRGVLYRRLREQRVGELPGLVEELVDWALSYQAEPNAAVRGALEAAAIPQDGLTSTPTDWDEPPTGDRSRRALDARERLIRATGQLVAQRGFENLSIPSISAGAGTSNATFYRHFGNKRDCFLAAFGAVADEALRVAAESFYSQGDRPSAVGAGLRRLLDYTASSRVFAQLCFYELPTAGPVALDHADRMLDRFAAFLRPGIVPSAFERELPPATLEAITSAVWAVIQHEIVEGRRQSLSDRGPEVAWVVLAPFVG